MNIRHSSQKYWPLILLGILILINACKKNDKAYSNIQPSASELLAKTKALLNTKALSSTLTIQQEMEKIGLAPEWAEANIIKNKNKLIVMGIPLTKSDSLYSELNTLSLNNVTYAIIKTYTKLPDGSVNLNFYSPDGKFLRHGKFIKSSQKFRPVSDRISVINLFKGERGKLMSSLQDVKIASGNGSGGNSDLDEGEDLDEVTIHGTAPNPPTVPDIDLPPDVNPNTQPTFPTDPIRDGAGSSEPEANNENQKIIDSLKGYPCAQELLKKLPNLSNKISELIKNNFNSGKPVDLKFNVNNSLSGTTVDGKLGGFAGLADGSVGTYTAGINPDVLGNASQEYILVTLYHEALHAYFDYMKKTLSATEFTNKFGNLTSDGGRTLFSEVNGHYEMAANNFLIGLRNAITSLNPNYDLDRAYALAKGGVVVLTAADKNINHQERDTRNPGFTGTACPK